MLVIESNEIREMEERAVSQGKKMSALMEQAGTKVAEIAAEIMYKKKLKKICVICGTGNNGGDGFVAARLLSVMNCNVTVILAGDAKSELAKMNFNLLPNKVSVLSFYSQQIDCAGVIAESEMIIDAVYGIGFRDALDPLVYELVQLCNDNKSAYRIAVDLPSGIVCDTGEIVNGCFHADMTITFTAMKPLHVLYPSMDYCGEIRIVSVGIPKYIYKSCRYAMKTTDEYIAENTMPKRRISAHKGTNGTLLSVCGSYGMAGAAVLSGNAALRTGVGLLKQAVPKSIYPIVAGKLTEAVFIPMNETSDGQIDVNDSNRLVYEMIEKAGAVLVGCGLGTGDNATRLVSTLVESCMKPMVIDADGINAVSTNIDILRHASGPLILTPHPGEMARLIQSSTTAVQQARYKIAKEFAQEYRVTLVLKGANTLIATPEGSVYVNRTGNNGMARGGSGDVLAGMMASFLAQGMSTEKAAIFSVFYHGLAGDQCAAKYSARAMLPGDMVDELKFLFSND